ncbi:hypothetical protein CYMTET_33866 [Cymbomonas tetramitiformis]|uniref:Uncharacterized protein n=1 Tax=Cymbomonas tetramitiformis TaxID=36881 RepID=A0AAE0FC53_9CHLO|nr:hypothetical protein CYMTET_33866 [Cymbomonas tetramitiformis]
MEAATRSGQTTSRIDDRIIVPSVNSVSPLVLQGTGPHTITLRGYGITGKLITLRIGGNCYTLPSAMAQGDWSPNRGQEEEVCVVMEELHDCWIDGGLAACAWVEVHCADGLGTSSAMPVLVATEEVAGEARGLNDLPRQEAAAMAQDLVEVLRPRPGGLSDPQAQLLRRTAHKLGAALFEKGLPRLAARVRSAEHPSPAAERPSPAAERPSPAAERPSPAAERPSPAAEHPSPAAEHPSPAAERIELAEQEAPRAASSLRWPQPVYMLVGKMIEWTAPGTLADEKIPYQALQCTVPRMCAGPLPMELCAAPLCMA